MSEDLIGAILLIGFVTICGLIEFVLIDLEDK